MPRLPPPLWRRPTQRSRNSALAPNGQKLQGSSVIGSICVDALPLPSTLVPWTPGGVGARTVNDLPVTLIRLQLGKFAVVGGQPLLDISEVAQSNWSLVLYGNLGQSIRILTSTNLADGNSWGADGSVTMTNLFQSVAAGSFTNPEQFFKAVAP